jgi:hypothetical protein
MVTLVTVLLAGWGVLHVACQWHVELAPRARANSTCPHDLTVMPTGEPSLEIH